MAFVALSTNTLIGKQKTSSILEKKPRVIHSVHDLDELTHTRGEIADSIIITGKTQVQGGIYDSVLSGTFHKDGQIGGVRVQSLVYTVSTASAALALGGGGGYDKITITDSTFSGSFAGTVLAGDIGINGNLSVAKTAVFAGATTLTSNITTTGFARVTGDGGVAITKGLTVGSNVMSVNAGGSGNVSIGGTGTLTLSTNGGISSSSLGAVDITTASGNAKLSAATGDVTLTAVVGTATLGGGGAAILSGGTAGKNATVTANGTTGDITIASGTTSGNAIVKSGTGGTNPTITLSGSNGDISINSSSTAGAITIASGTTTGSTILKSGTGGTNPTITLNGSNGDISINSSSSNGAITIASGTSGAITLTGPSSSSFVANSASSSISYSGSTVKADGTGAYLQSSGSSKVSADASTGNVTLTPSASSKYVVIANLNTSPGTNYLTVDGSGQISQGDAIVSSRRYKKDIEYLEANYGTTLDSLKPVSFVYKNDENNRLNYGLIAEEVAEILPEIIIYDKDDLIQTLDYRSLATLHLQSYLNDRKVLSDHETRLKSAEDVIQILIAEIAALKNS